MAGGIDACEVEAEQLMDDLLFGDLVNAVGLSLGFGFGNESVVFPHLVYVYLNEVFFMSLWAVHSRIKQLNDCLSDFQDYIVKISVCLSKVDSGYFLAENERPK
jgi:hypothetical protein